MISLEQLTSGKEDKKNKGNRTGGGGRRGQNFEYLKYSTNTKGGRFQFATKLWDSLGLDNHGLFQSNVRENSSDPKSKLVGVYLGLVSDKEENKDLKPTILNHSGKSENKTNSITSNVLEDALIELGVMRKVEDSEIVENKPVHQYIKLEKVEAPAMDGLKAVFQLVVDTEGGTVSTEGDEEGDESDEKEEAPQGDADVAGPSESESSFEEEEVEEVATKPVSALDDY